MDILKEETLLDPLNSATPARILALDVGRLRIGLAVTDPLGLAPQGLDTMHRTNLRDDLRRVAGVAQECSAKLLLVGDPVHMRGASSEMSTYVRGFGDRLRAKTRLPVQYWDERLTSVTAEERLRELGVRFERGDGKVDRMAAIVLLESYLHTSGGAYLCE